MALSGRAPGMRVVAVATMVVGLLSAHINAQPSGALAASEKSAWNRVLGSRQYEYDERIDLSLDGTAIVDVNASLAALVALHGASFDLDPEARLDRLTVRAFFEGEGAAVREVTAFRRHGRRFVHVRLAVIDIRNLSRIAPLSWSTYQFRKTDAEYQFVQDVGPPARVTAPQVGWTGDELVAFRLHLPSRITFHNPPDQLERGNILAWEQRLSDRMAGLPLHMEARMETQSILYRTLWLFAGTFVAALALLGTIVWWVARKGRGGNMVPA